MTVEQVNKGSQISRQIQLLEFHLQAIPETSESVVNMEVYMDCFDAYSYKSNVNEKLINLRKQLAEL